MDMIPILPETELEAMAAQYLGKLLFVFGRLEMNVGLALAHAGPASRFEQEVVRIEGLSFDQKLSGLRDKALSRYAGNQQAGACWTQWCDDADQLRLLRKDFAHGRWGFVNAVQQIVYAENLPGSPNQAETRYTLEEFAARIAGAEDVADRFDRLCKQYPVVPGHV